MAGGMAWRSESVWIVGSSALYILSKHRESQDIKSSKSRVSSLMASMSSTSIHFLIIWISIQSIYDITRYTLSESEVQFHKFKVELVCDDRVVFDI